MDVAPAAYGLREVPSCHFKGLNAPRGTLGTDLAISAVKLRTVMGDTGGHAAPARVLVVDDEPSIRLLCRVNLELDGHEVLEADSVETAREALASGDVDVVLLDVHLRGGRSDALIGECQARRPPVPVVLVTGSADVTEDGLTAADAVLPKPFELDALLATVRDLARARTHR